MGTNAPQEEVQVDLGSGGRVGSGGQVFLKSGVVGEESVAFVDQVIAEGGDGFTSLFEEEDVVLEAGQVCRLRVLAQGDMVDEGERGGMFGKEFGFCGRSSRGVG